MPKPNPTPVRPRAARGGTWVAWLAVLALAAWLALVLAGPLKRLQPTALPVATLTQLPCVSYAPFRRAGHTPFDAQLKLTPAQIEEDLRLLARVTTCVRTYGLDHGLDAVPAVARRVGLRVKLGAWIGRDAQANDAQLSQALALAREHADVVDLLIVGNEVLLRRELAPEALATLLARAKRESPVPVTYADVWEFWVRHSTVLRPHVSLVAAHVLPYWEDEPLALAQAVDHVHAITAHMRETFAPLPVWVAETGWPALGRQRGPAVPGREEQARFVRELMAREAKAPLGFNLIEGFDQPWKRMLEGAMGGAWGVFDAEGTQRVPLTGPLPPEREARSVLLAAGVGALLGALWGALGGAKRRQRGMQANGPEGPAVHTGTHKDLFLAVSIATLLGAASGALAMQQWHAMWAWNRNALEWGVSAMWLVTAVGCAVAFAPRALAAWTGADVAQATKPLMGFVPSMQTTGAHRAQSFVLLAWLFASAWLALLLVFDGRYRVLVQPWAAVPAVLLLGLALSGHRLGTRAREERVLAVVCALAAVAMLVQEGWHNAQAWTAACILWATASVAWPVAEKNTPRPHLADPSTKDVRDKVINAINTPAAPGPAA